jgi:malate dehydrogenase
MVKVVVAGAAGTCFSRVVLIAPYSLSFNSSRRFTGGIGQPLSLLMKLNPLVTELSLYDVVNAVGVSLLTHVLHPVPAHRSPFPVQVAADLSHIPTPAQVTGFLPNTGSGGPKSEDEQGQGAINAIRGADLVVIPAGVPRKPGMT